MEDESLLKVDDVTVEELSESTGAASFATVGTASSLSTPIGTAACVGSAGSYSSQ